MPSGTPAAPAPSEEKSVERERSEPFSAEEHNAEGRRLYEMGQYLEAVAHFQSAIELDHRNPLYHCNLGVTFSELDLDDAALEKYNEAIRIAPEDPTAYLNLGYFHSERENPAEARPALEKVIEVAPGSPEADEARQILESFDEL
jgi:tetratricopeptide (TPR) repeat protein